MVTTFIHKSFPGHMFSFLFGKYLGMELLAPKANICLIL